MVPPLYSIEMFLVAKLARLSERISKAAPLKLRLPPFAVVMLFPKPSWPPSDTRTVPDSARMPPNMVLSLLVSTIVVDTPMFPFTMLLTPLVPPTTWPLRTKFPGP